MNISRLASAVYNDIVSGLQGFEATQNMSVEQLEDEVIEERISLIQKYAAKGVLSLRDFAYAINCIPVDCKSLEGCCDEALNISGKIPHFEIPPIVNDLGERAIIYMGSTDRQVRFKVYTSPQAVKYQKYKQRRANKPFVYLSTFPNENGNYDGYIYNAPLLETLRVEAIFKDPRDLKDYNCCVEIEDENYTSLDTEIKKNLIEKKLRYYRQFQQPPMPNDQAPK